MMTGTQAGLQAELAGLKRLPAETPKPQIAMRGE
jgi:hypothetical protein